MEGCNYLQVVISINKLETNQHCKAFFLAQGFKEGKKPDKNELKFLYRLTGFTSGRLCGLLMYVIIMNNIT